MKMKMKIHTVQHLKAQIVSWTDGDGEDGNVTHGVDLKLSADLPSWAEPMLVECNDKPGQFEAIEVHSGAKHLVIMPHMITLTMILEEQARRQAQLFSIPVETLARLTRPQRLWIGERAVEAEGVQGLVIDLAELSTDELHTLDSFYGWLEAHQHERVKKLYNNEQENDSAEV